jgi:hypothetical protein
MGSKEEYGGCMGRDTFIFTDLISCNFSQSKTTDINISFYVKF